MKQLSRISQDGILMENGRVVKVNLFECHDLVANVSPMGNNLSLVKVPQKNYTHGYR